jgi:predicted carbohydrate-binding protein with CBM5 and CBM33 domain
MCHAVDRDLAGIARKYEAAALRAAILDPKGLKVERSFTSARLNDTKLASAQQRHRALLENYSAEEVANVVAYLASVR